MGGGQGLSLEIESFSTRHGRRGFSRGVAPLDEYPRRHARQYERHEFEWFPDDPLTLWLPTGVLERL